MPRQKVTEPKRMTREEFIAEVTYFLDCDVHPHQIAASLGITYEAIGIRLRNADRHGLTDALPLLERLKAAVADNSWRGSDWKPWQARAAS